MKKTRYIPYGYTIRNGRTVVEHTEADIIREIFRNYTEGASLKDIADMLTKRQIPYTEKTSVWDKARIARIIDNGKYTGNEEYDPIIDIELYDHAVRMKMARQTYQAKTDCEGLAVIRPRIKCEKCNSPMIRHIRSRDRIKENWTCTNPECGMMVRISDGHLLEKITVLMNRIIENSKLLIPTPKEKHKDSPTVAYLQMDIESEINGGHPSEEYIIEKIGSIASELYRESNPNAMIATRVAMRRTSMMKVQETFNPDYFTDLVAYLTIDENKRIIIHTKTEAEIPEGEEHGSQEDSKEDNHGD